MIRIALRTLLFLLAGALVLVLGGVLALRLGAATWAVNLALEKINPVAGSRLRAGEAVGNGFSWLELRDLRLTGGGGEVPLSVPNIRIYYDPMTLLTNTIVVHELRLLRPSVAIQQAPDSSWGLPRFKPRKPKSPDSVPRKITIQSISLIDGGILVRHDALKLDSITASLEAEGSLTERGLQLSRLALRSQLAYRSLRFLGSGFDRDGEVALTVNGTGTTHRMEFELNATLPEGGTAEVRGVITPPKSSPVEYRFQGDFRGIDPSLFLSGQVLPRRIDGTMVVDLVGASPDRLGGRTDVTVRASRAEPRDRRQVVAGALFDEGRGRIKVESNLGFASVWLGGWVRPFDSLPSYDLEARAHYRERISFPWLKRLLGEERRTLTLSLAGTGLDPERANLRLQAAVAQASSPTGLLDSGSAQVRLNDGTARMRAVIGVTGGTVAVAGTATLGPELELRLDRGSIKGVDVAALLGDSSASSLDAAFTLESRGASPRLAVAQASVLDAGLSYGSHSVIGGRFNVSIDRGTVHLNGEARVDGAFMDATAAARPFDAEPSVTVRRLRFLKLDLARLVPESGLPGEISGTVRGQARGRRLDRLRLSTVISLDPSRIGKHPLDHARLEADMAGGRVVFEADADAPAGRVALAGFARPFDTVPTYVLQDAEFRELDLGRLLSQQRLRTRLAGSLQAEGSGRAPEDATATSSLTLRSSTINDAVITGGRVEVKLARQELDLSGIFRAEGDSLTMVARAYPFESRPRVRLRSDVAIKAVAQFLGRDFPDAGGTAGIRVEGQLGSPETLSLQGELFGRGHVGEVQLDSLRTRIGVKDGVLTVDTLALRTSVGTAAGSGKVAWFGRAARSSDLRLVGRLGNIAQMAPLLGVTRMALDSGSFTASVKGPRDGLRLGLVAQAGNLEVGSRRVGALRASLSGELAADHSLASGTADVHLERLLTGRTRVSEIRVQGTKQGSAVLLRAESVVDQERNARLVTHFDLDSSRARLDTLDVKLEDTRWTLAHPVRVAYGDRIQVDDFLLAAGGRRIAIDGVVDRRGEQQLNARVDSLRLGPWAEFFGAPEMDGEINGTMKLSGPAATPHAEGQVDVAIRSRDKRVGTAKGRLDWSTAGLLLEIGLRQPAGDSLKFTGRIPVALSLEAGDSAGLVRRIPGGRLALDAVTEGFELDALEPLFNPETVRKIRGRLAMNAHAAGTIEAPQLSGEVTLADARVQIPRLGASYDKGQVRLRLQGQEVRVVQARMESGGGHLGTQGTIHLRAFPQVAFDLQTTLSKFRIAAAEDFRSSLSGTLKLGGGAAAPVLTGSLDVRNSDVYLQAKNLQQSAEAVELSPEDLRTLDRRFGYSVAGRAGEARKPLAPWDIDLKVRLTENNWLRRRSDPVMAVELAGKLDVRKAPGEDINVFGEIQPLPGRSFVQVMGRRFELREGAVNLSGPLAQTAVALKAEYRAPSPSGTQPVVITTGVQSDSGKLTVTLSSIPVMRAEDIMSYLTTGRPASTDPTLASDEQGALSTSASLAVGAALGTVAGSAGQKLGFDVVQVLQDREGGQTLVAGKYVSPPLYLGFRQPIVPSTDPGSSETETEVVEFEVEYAALRQLLLNLQGGGSEFRIFLRLRR